ncbi:hypothetical protein RKE29_24240 [Streptomyces sp. B1866]|uniref:hypothetical protein n=1 Tax=Streptomyces sp. B1866 TaxID=3075431 RepID=UPI002890A92E|nr:hypothetical protein [Streptomyces sp. B1866]MDT3399711.1 hypothetical protein [Streptomyces sp. B1866]
MGAARVWYMRCPECGAVAPVGTVAQRCGVDQGVRWQLPVEVVCAMCGAQMPVAHGDAVPCDTDVRCRGRRRLLRRAARPGGWWPCLHVFRVPADAVRVRCPHCATSQPGPAARPTRR